MRRGNEESRTSKIYKTYYHLLLHPKLLLVPSISMKEKIGRLLDATVVESPAKFILSTSDNLWVTLHDDNIVRIWSISDGRCLMFSPKDLFLTKLIRIFPIPTYDGYLLCFGEEGDVYIINMFRMRLLKHSKIDVNGLAHISLVKVDKESIWLLISDNDGKISSWRIKTNTHGMNLQTVCSENDFEIDFELKKQVIMPDEYCARYLLVYSEDIKIKGKNQMSQSILTVSRKKVNLIQYDNEVEMINEVEKFNDIDDIIFAASVQKNEGVYILLITETYDLYIDRYDQLGEDTAPLIQINLLESSFINNSQVSSARLEELLEGRTLKYDDNSKMLYFVIHEKKRMIAWFINDMLRNSRFYTYGNNQDIFKPESIPLQCCSTDIFSDQESSESEIFLHEGNHTDIGHNLISFNDIITEELK